MCCCCFLPSDVEGLLLQFTRNRTHSIALIPRLWGRGGSQKLRDAQFKELASISLPKFRNSNFPPKMMLPLALKSPMISHHLQEKKIKQTLYSSSEDLHDLNADDTSNIYHSSHRACLLDIPPICHSVPPPGPYTCHHYTCILYPIISSHF